MRVEEFHRWAEGRAPAVSIDLDSIVAVSAHTPAFEHSQKARVHFADGSTMMLEETYDKVKKAWAG